MPELEEGQKAPDRGYFLSLVPIAQADQRNKTRKAGERLRAPLRQGGGLQAAPAYQSTCARKPSPLIWAPSLKPPSISDSL